MDLEKIKHISRLLFLRMKNALSADEEKELDDWRNSSPVCEKIFHEVVEEENWRENIRQFVKTGAEEKAEWEMILSRTIQKQRRINWSRILGYAALVVFVLGISYLALNKLISKDVENHELVFNGISYGGPKATLTLPDGRQIALEQYSGQPGEPYRGFEVDTSGNTLRYKPDQPVELPEYHTLTIPSGGEYIVVLNDGTKIYLNSESELKYPVRFTSRTRSVFLKGEAYFEVAHNEKCPFIVNLGDMQVRVLGTSFGVRVYDDEDIMTTLVAGRVNVCRHGEEVALKPNEQALYSRRQDRMVVRTVDTRLFVGWKDGRLIFDNSSLETIFNALSRWYNFQVVYTNDSLKKIPFSLDIIRHSKIQTILDLLQRTGKVSFEIDKNIVIVK